jgi:hypothetical protein
VSTWIIRRVVTEPAWQWDDVPPVILENRIGSTPRLQRDGVKLENRVYAPVVREGDFYQTQPGDELTSRIRIEQQIVHEDGSTITITREAVDTGKNVPQFVQTTDSSISDEERAQGDELRAQYNQQVFEQNLINDYTEPYSAPLETAPDSAYSSYDPGYVESAPIAVPQGTYTPPTYYQPDTQTVQYNPTPAISDTVNAVVNVGGWVQDILTPVEVSDPWADWLAYQAMLDQMDAEGASGWSGPID